MTGLLAAATLAQREIVRFVRQRSRVTSALLQPLVFWGLFSAGLGGSFRPAGGETAAAYLFPGMLVMVLLFTSIFSTISLIEDRREGFLQGVLVSPAPRWAIVAGKVGGATALASAQGALFLCLAPLAGLPLGAGAAARAVAILPLVSFPLAAAGFSIAWRMESTQGFHAVMMLFLMPMWILAGTIFPPEGAAPWLAAVMRANPLTYGVAALRGAMHAASGGPSTVGSLAVTAFFGVAAFSLASGLAARPRRAGRP